MSMKERMRILPFASIHRVHDGFPPQIPVSIDREAVVASFLMLDYAGHQSVCAGRYVQRGGGMHPHRAVETVTIVYQGAHRDTVGNGEASGQTGTGRAPACCTRSCTCGD